MLLVCVLLWLVGTAWGSAPLWAWAAGTTIGAVGVAWGRRRPGWWPTRLLSAAILVPVAAGYAQWRGPAAPPTDLQDWFGERVQVAARVVSARGEPGRISALIDLETVLRPRACPLQGRLQVIWPALQAPPAGSRWLFDGELLQPKEAPLPGLFDRSAWLVRQDIHAQLSVKRWARLAGEIGWLESLRLRFVPLFTQGSDGVRGPLAASLVFGVTAAPLDPDLVLVFRDLGLSHVLAASGFQLSLFVATTLLLLERYGRQRAIAICLPLLLVYVALTGAPPSVVRAAGLTFIGLAGRWFERQTVTTTALLLVAWGMLLWDPGYVHDLGFAFSVLATWGLIVTAPAMERRLEAWMPWLPAWARTLIVTPLAAQLWVLPLQLHAFGHLSWLSLPGNVVSAFLVDWLTRLGLLAAILGLCWMPLAWPLTWAIGQLLAVWLPLLTWAAAVPGQSWYVPRPDGLATLALYGVLLLLHAPQERWGAWGAIGGWSLACTVVGIHLLPASRPLRLDFLPVGAGSACHVALPGGEHWLVDAGSAIYLTGGRWDAGERRIVPYLRALGLRHLDGILLTSPAGHHIGGLGAVVQAFPPRQLVEGGGAESRTLTQVAPLLADAGIPWDLMPDGGWRWPDGAALQAWRVTRADGERQLCLRWQLGACSILMPGDLDDHAAAGHAWPPSDVLVLPAHGRESACPASLLAAVRPRWALLEGAARRWGRPKPALAQRLRQYGVRLWDLTRDGPLRLETDGRSVRLFGLAQGDWQVRHEFAGRPSAGSPPGRPGDTACLGAEHHETGSDVADFRF